MKRQKSQKLMDDRDRINIPPEVVKDKSITKGLLGCLPFILSSIFLHASFYYRNNVVADHSLFHSNPEILFWTAILVWAFSFLAIFLFGYHSLSMVERKHFHSIVPLGLVVTIAITCTCINIYILSYYNVL
ncbi:uncharacterized protein METZ01_LOCUS85566 [marine metagenome]|uniref:Uncharacterized protein n=1 Tax=marine metagenome TaxID=408172 RepID=A0A381UX48_9ZZZZ